MCKLYPYFTNDGSVGLFSPEADDIYHSTYGALSEAYEKFILPANIEYYFKQYKKINVLDICYGIGYNSKSFLNFYFDYEKNLTKKLYNEAIYTDNILGKFLNILNRKNKLYIAKIHTNNILPEIFIHAIDNDKNLFLLSPFIKTQNRFFVRDKLSFEHEKINKLRKVKVKSKYKIKKEVIENFENIFEETELNEILSIKKYKRYFDRFICSLFQFYKFERGNNTLLSRLRTFLHNIYYRYISNSHKKALKCLKTKKINFKPEIDDARNVIKNSDMTYQIIFLDAFTPAKCPCLWSKEFFDELFKHLDDNGLVLTYSNSACVRNAFLQSGFHIAKIYNAELNKYYGTAAFKNKNIMINNNFLHELSEYDLGLIKTKAGIVYHDKNLSLNNEVILAAHKKETENSNLISSSKFIKMMKNFDT